MPDDSPRATAEPEMHAGTGRLAQIAAKPAVPGALAVLIGLVDYLSGPTVSLGVVYLVPLTVAAVFGHTVAALVIGLALPIARLSYFAFDVWEPPGSYAHVAINAGVRAIVLTLVVVLIWHARRARLLDRRVRALYGLLPICMYCKRVEEADGRWSSIEQYLAARSDAAFTHRVCPVCTGTHRNVFLGS
jgi:hypothetical protein